METLKKMIQKELKKSGKKTRKEMQAILERNFPVVMSEKEKKKINQKKGTVDEILKNTQKLIYNSFLDTAINPGELKSIAESTEKARVLLQNPKITEKEINDIINELTKEINELTKSHPQLLQILAPKPKKKGFIESRKEQRKIRDDKKGLEEIVRYMNKMISDNLDTLPQTQVSYFLEIIQQTKDALRKP